MERFFELAHDLFLISDADGSHRRVNAAWTVVLGWSREEIEARKIIELAHPDDRAGLEAAAAGLRVSPHARVRVRMLHRDGTYRWIDWHAILDVDTSCIYAAGRDVTGEVELRDELIEKEAKLKLLASELLQVRGEEHARIANELHDSAAQQCVAALMYLDLEAAHDANVPVPEGAVRTQVVGCLESIRSIMAGLDAPRPEGGLEETVRVIVREVGHQFPLDIELECRIAGEVPVAVAATACRILREGLVNTAKHAASPAVRVSFIGDGDSLMVRVDDDGAPPNAAEGSSQAGGVSRGSGLGLAWLREAAHVHGGDLTISFAITGTTLTANLPYVGGATAIGLAAESVAAALA